MSDAAKEKTAPVTELPLSNASSQVSGAAAPEARGESDSDTDLSGEIFRKWWSKVGVISMGFAILMIALQNPTIFRLDEQTIDFLSQAVNAMVLLTIPFLLGNLGAAARLLLSGSRLSEERALITGSGLMACFSWISIKSGVLVSVIAPHLATHGVEAKEALSAPNSFYTMALVATLVGMFSTNLYLFITHRVEQLSNRADQGNSTRS